jgi:hypothetical protein
MWYEITIFERRPLTSEWNALPKSALILIFRLQFLLPKLFHNERLPILTFLPTLSLVRHSMSLFEEILTKMRKIYHLTETSSSVSEISNPYGDENKVSKMIFFEKVIASMNSRSRRVERPRRIKECIMIKKPSNWEYFSIGFVHNKCHDAQFRGVDRLSLKTGCFLQDFKAWFR